MAKDMRIILISGEINENVAMDVILRLLLLDKQSHTEEIVMYINSNGGSILSGLAIYDAINYIQAPVSTVCFGMAASMGAFLLSCGKRGRRFALPHSRILIHQPLIYSSSPILKTQSSLAKMAKQIENSRYELEMIMAHNLSKSFEEVHQDCERDNWMSAVEAKEYGIIDKVLE